MYRNSNQTPPKLCSGLAFQTKVDRSFNVYFFGKVYFSLDMKVVMSTTWLANPNQGHSQLPHRFQYSYEYLGHYLSEDSPPHYTVI